MHGYGAHEANCEACGDHGKWPACGACGMCHDCKRYNGHALSCSASAEATGVLQHSIVNTQSSPPRPSSAGGRPLPWATTLSIATSSGVNQNDQGPDDRRLRLTAGSQWKHVKSGKHYTVLGFCKDATNGRTFNVLAMVRYRGDDFQEWVRAEVEFLDGRFEPL